MNAWRVKRRRDPELFTADPAPDTNVSTSTGDALTDAELERLQRDAAVAARKATRNGKAADARNWTIQVAVLDDKLSKRRRERVAEPLRDDGDADIMERATALLGELHQRRARALLASTDDELARGIARRRADIRLEYEQIAALHAEQVRRRRGTPRPDVVPECFTAMTVLDAVRVFSDGKARRAVDVERDEPVAPPSVERPYVAPPVPDVVILTDPPPRPARARRVLRALPSARRLELPAASTDEARQRRAWDDWQRMRQADLEAEREANGDE